MKIAIPTRGKNVDEHFGHCEYYTIVHISEDKKIDKTESFEAPVGCGCKSNIASVLADMGVELMLAGNMGQGAVNKLNSAGLRVIRGCSGNVDEVAKAYVNDEITDSGIVCSNHDHEHQCNH